eukprot:CAMPEP_0194317158 /NCGR_PEP_ID=MMETSP0171-20130528/13908_1 /TAXON_ID=218684 /ORGANISM="Corethron pennatum, Strain L29A3" /LENGTH=152 /DNA_ID=CAMNT_0039073655 /DNA_START=128 /DNA_END=587 /DNA_ORIENTATION=-
MCTIKKLSLTAGRVIERGTAWLNADAHHELFSAGLPLQRVHGPSALGGGHRLRALRVLEDLERQPVYEAPVQSTKVDMRASPNRPERLKDSDASSAIWDLLERDGEDVSTPTAPSRMMPESRDAHAGKFLLPVSIVSTDVPHRCQRLNAAAQ